MAQLVVSAVGAAVGFMIGGPAGAQVGWVAGSMVGAYAFAQTQHQEGPRLKDLKITGTDYGETVPWVAGSPRIAGQIIWASNRREHKQTQRQGGKGGGGATSTTYTYSVDLLILLTENEMSGVSRVWSNNELVYANGDAKDGLWREMRVYTGAADQMPDPLYEAAVGVGNAPAYRGRGYVVIENLDLGGSGNIPNLTFEIGEGVSSENVTCIAVIDENQDVGTPVEIQARVNAQWADFRARFPRRVFHVIQPIYWQIGDGQWEEAPGEPYVVYMPEADDSRLHGPHRVRRDSGLVHAREDWYSICGLDRLPNDSSVVLFVDQSGSMTLDTVRASYDLFLARCAARGIQVLPVFNANEDYITPFYNFDDVPGSGSQVSKDLEGTVAALMQRAGYADDEFDVSALRGLGKPLRALALSQVSSTRSALEALQKSWFFECSAADKIVIRARATQPVVRIPFADLGFTSDSGGSDEPLALKLGNDLEQPAQLALTYANMASDYNADTQFSDRLVTGQASTQTLQLPLGMLPAEAKACADALLFDMVASMHSTTLHLPLRYAYLETGDVVEALAQDGRVLRLRVVQIKRTGMTLAAECCLDDVGALESAAITDTGYISVQDPTRVPDTLWHALDIPLLRDADDAPGYYLAAAPDSINVQTDQWKGAVAALSWDGVDYVHLQTLLDASVLGVCTSVLPAWSGGAVFDEASTLTVQMRGQLESSTREAMLLDDAINGLLVGSEIVRFRHAELLTSDVPANVFTYQISSLLRGCRGTEWAMGAHQPNERCVLLTGALRRQQSQSNEMQREMQLKVLTTGKFLADVEPRAFVDTGVALKPFSPAGLRGLVDAAGVHLRWQRRTRLAYRYGGSAPVVPLGEAIESYRLQVWHGAELLRTEFVSVPQVDYTPAMRAEDGLAGGELLHFVVAQVSAAVGPGYESSIERSCV